MKFSERVWLKMPKQTIPRQEYEILARSRYSRCYGLEPTERINSQEMSRAPDVLEKIGFVVVRNMLTGTATSLFRSGSLRNKAAVLAMQQAWGRVYGEDTAEEPGISQIIDEPGFGVRFNQPGSYMIMPADWSTVAVSVTQRRHVAKTTLRPSDALAWRQGDAYFPSVEMYNLHQHPVGSFVLHESVQYADPLLAQEVPPVSQ